MAGVFLVKAVIPKKKIDAEKWGLAILAALSAEGEIIRRMYKKTVKTWSAPRPIFKVEASLGAPGPRGGLKSESASVKVFTPSQKYAWVDEGTKGPYRITAKNKPLLIFAVGGKPKTKPNVIGSTQGKPGTMWRSKPFVIHPGIKPRNFSEEIQKRRRKPFYKKMKEANRKAQKKYGW